MTDLETIEALQANARALTDKIGALSQQLADADAVIAAQYGKVNVALYERHKREAIARHKSRTGPFA